MRKDAVLILVGLFIGLPVLNDGLIRPLAAQQATQEAAETKAAESEEGEPDPSCLMSEGAVEFIAAKDWKRKKPRSRIINHEFEIQPATADEKPGRLTVSSAMGTIDANIARWRGQFSQPDGSKTDDHTKIEKLTLEGHQVHLVDITGTFADQPGGPFGPKTDRPDYRMLAAIVNVKDAGQYFLKMYGPKTTVTKQEEAFRKFVKSLKVK